MATDTPPAPKVVAALDEAGDLAVSEQALDLALFGRVALLDLARHGGEGLHIVALRRTGRAADAVAARAAAEQDNDVTRGGTLAHNVLGGRRGDDRAALKAFGNVALVVELGDMARGKADLVAVGRISRRRGLRPPSRGGASLMFKNETHNHPTEIEPFGGAATCIGGRIRDPLPLPALKAFGNVALVVELGDMARGKGGLGGWR